MGHARLSPSASKRWIKCAASPAREAGLPDTDSPAAMDGSNAHAYLESLLLDDLVPLPYPTRSLPPELEKQAEDCYDYIQRRLKELPLATVRPETRVSPALFTNRGDGDGTADAIIVSQGTLEVIDLKTGGGYVEETDPQLKIYGLGALADYLNPTTLQIPFETIRLTVFQPKRPRSPAQIERYIELTPAELLDWCATVYNPAATATDAPDAPATPDKDACHFCKARPTCPEHAAAMDQHFGALFTMSNDTENPLNLLTSGTAVNDLSPEQIAALLDVAPMIQARIKDAQERADKDLKNGKSIPGWKLVRGNSRRAWTDEDVVLAEAKRLKLKQDDYAPRSLRSPAQMQGLGLPVKKWQAFESLIETKAGNLVLVPETDKRASAIAQDPGFAPVLETDWLN